MLGLRYVDCRSHTEKVSADHVEAGGKEWDTVKPLHKWFKHMHRVLLMDDDAYKVCTLFQLGCDCMSAFLTCAASATVDNHNEGFLETFCSICCRVAGTLVKPGTF
jgi:hypothetical protein